MLPGRDTSRGRRMGGSAVSLVLLLFSLSFILSACEKPDYKGVTFRPKEADLEAYRTSLTVIAAERVEAERLLGKGGSWRPAGLLGQHWRPLKDIVAVLDGEEVLPLDERGVASREEIPAGPHSLALSRFSGRSEAVGPVGTHGRAGRTAAPRVAVEPIFAFPVDVVKDEMTVALVDETGGRHRVFIETGEHDFILERVSRRLAGRAGEVMKLVDGLVAMYSGRLPKVCWPELFDAATVVSGGGPGDYLQALAYRIDCGEWRKAVLDVLVCTFDKDGAELLLKLARPGAPAFFERFVAREVSRERPALSGSVLEGISMPGEAAENAGGGGMSPVERRRAFARALADADGRRWRVVSIGRDPAG